MEMSVVLASDLFLAGDSARDCFILGSLQDFPWKFSIWSALNQ